jgi:hypothetical protein
MTSRQHLDQALLHVTGEDIRLVGNWDQIPGFPENAEQLAERLNIPKPQLLRCRDISDVLVLMETRPEETRVDIGPSLF